MSSNCPSSDDEYDGPLSDVDSSGYHDREINKYTSPDCPTSCRFEHERPKVSTCTVMYGRRCRPELKERVVCPQWSPATDDPEPGEDGSANDHWLWRYRRREEEREFQKAVRLYEERKVYWQMVKDYDREYFDNWLDRITTVSTCLHRV